MQCVGKIEETDKTEETENTKRQKLNMKAHNEETLKLMRDLLYGYSFDPCENRAFYTHIMNRKDITPAISARLHDGAEQPSIYVPPRLLLTSGPTFTSSWSVANELVRDQLTEYLQQGYDILQRVLDLTLVSVFHLIVLDAHVLYSASAARHIQAADLEGISIPTVPAPKVLAFEVAFVVYQAQNHQDFELADYKEQPVEVPEVPNND
jgi:hypothetical protein